MAAAPDGKLTGANNSLLDCFQKLVELHCEWFETGNVEPYDELLAVQAAVAWAQAYAVANLSHLVADAPAKAASHAKKTYNKLSGTAALHIIHARNALTLADEFKQAFEEHYKSSPVVVDAPLQATGSVPSAGTVGTGNIQERAQSIIYALCVDALPVESLGRILSVLEGDCLKKMPARFAAYRGKLRCVGPNYDRPGSFYMGALAAAEAALWCWP